MELRRRVASTVIGFSLLLLIFTTVVFLKFDTIYRKLLNERVKLREGSQTDKLWRDVGLGFRTAAKFYFFNITNPEEIQRGAPAQLRELGPYTYRTKWVRDNITFNGNGTVTFTQKIFYFFDEQESGGTEDDVITIINVPLAAFADQIKGKSFVVRGLARIPVKKFNLQLLVRRTIRELTFQGYPDVLVTLKEMAKDREKDLSGLFRSGFRTAVDVLGKKSQDSFKTFSFMGDKNGTRSETMTMFTGEGDITKVNNIQLVNGETHVPVWTEPCNIVQGSFGQVRPPFSASNDQAVFIPDLLRSLPLSYAGKSVVNRIKTRRFSLDEKAFASAELVPENACYAGSRTLPSGLADLGPLRMGAPIAMSLPHFLNANASLQNAIQGLKPNGEQHMLYLDSDPVTGVTLAARARIQLNVLLQQVPGFDPFKNIQSQVVPLFWQETCADAKENTLRNIRLATRLPFYVKTLATVLFVLSMIAFAAALTVLIRFARYQKRRITTKDEKQISVLLLEGSGHQPSDIKSSIV
ncbi:platelet glycoprotein 4-like [Ornithodoros turicata]|uniref:platelet glycoprotein 4-like n=1 Tax=Ornithodoros turicata TaxID=34597 RepID=UPI003139BE10